VKLSGVRQIFANGIHLTTLFIDATKEWSHIPCMTYSSKLTSKNQTTLPKAIATLLGAKPSSLLSYEVMDDRSVRLTAKSAGFADHLASFPRKKPRQPVTVEAMKQAAAEGAVRRFKKAAR